MIFGQTLLRSNTNAFAKSGFEAVTVSARAAPALRRLADERQASGAALARAGLGRLMSDWQRRGYASMEK